MNQKRKLDSSDVVTDYTMPPLSHKTTPTPGPWFPPSLGLNVYGAKRRLICTVSSSGSEGPRAPERGEADANAKLIAQAPAMAEALTECNNLLTYLADGEEMGAANNGCVWDMERVERAIQNVRDVLRDAGVLV